MINYDVFYIPENYGVLYPNQNKNKRSVKAPCKVNIQGQTLREMLYIAKSMVVWDT